jgi:hypothetical protein
VTIEAAEVALPGGGVGEVVPLVQGGELVVEDFDMGVLHHPAYLLDSVENGRRARRKYRRRYTPPRTA